MAGVIITLDEKTISSTKTSIFTASCNQFIAELARILIDFTFMTLAMILYVNSLFFESFIGNQPSFQDIMQSTNSVNVPIISRYSA